MNVAALRSLNHDAVAEPVANGRIARVEVFTDMAAAEPRRFSSGPSAAAAVKRAIKQQPALWSLIVKLPRLRAAISQK